MFTQGDSDTILLLILYQTILNFEEWRSSMKISYSKVSQVIAIIMLVAMTLVACNSEDKTKSGASSENESEMTKTDEQKDETEASEADELEGFEFDEVTLRFGTASAEGNIIVDTMKDFSQRVSEKTSGKVTIDIYPGSQLGDVKAMTQSLQVGALDMSMTQPASLADMGVKEMSVLVLPYIFRDFEHRWNVLESEIGKNLLKEIDNKELGLKGFGYFKDGARSFFTTEGNAIRSLEDVAGMKLRVQPYEMDSDMTMALGASPTPTAFAELYSALQSGVVDGAEQPVAGYYKGKFYEVTKYYTLDEHTYNTLVVLFSDLSWNQLQPEVQTILTECWSEATAATKDKIVEAEEEMLAKLEEEGVEVIRLNDKEKWVEAMQAVYDKHGAGLEDIIKEIKEKQ